MSEIIFIGIIAIIAILIFVVPKKAATNMSKQADKASDILVEIGIERARAAHNAAIKEIVAGDVKGVDAANYIKAAALCYYFHNVSNGDQECSIPDMIKKYAGLSAEWSSSKENSVLENLLIEGSDISAEAKTDIRKISDCFA